MTILDKITEYLDQLENNPRTRMELRAKDTALLTVQCAQSRPALFVVKLIDPNESGERTLLETKSRKEVEEQLRVGLPFFLQAHQGSAALLLVQNVAADIR